MEVTDFTTVKSLGTLSREKSQSCFESEEQQLCSASKIYCPKALDSAGSISRVKTAGLKE